MRAARSVSGAVAAARAVSHCIARAIRQSERPPSLGRGSQTRHRALPGAASVGGTACTGAKITCGGIVTTSARGTAQLGDLIAAVFDEAARYSTDPKQVARLATRAVQHLLRHSRIRSGSPLSARISPTHPRRAARQQNFGFENDWVVRTSQSARQGRHGHVVYTPLQGAPHGLAIQA